LPERQCRSLACGQSPDERYYAYHYGVYNFLEFSIPKVILKIIFEYFVEILYDGYGRPVAKLPIPDALGDWFFRWE